MEGKVDLTERFEAIKKEFSDLQEEAKKLGEQGAVIQRRLSEIRDRQLQLQGASEFVTNLAKDAKKESEPELVTPSKKKENGEEESIN